MTRWKRDEVTTAQNFAHEIAHTLGIYHDFDVPPQSPNARNHTCGPGKYDGGPSNQIMNYGRPRLSTWSDCSNLDFSNYYFRVYANSPNGFCLKGKFNLNTI